MYLVHPIFPFSSGLRLSLTGFWSLKGYCTGDMFDFDAESNKVSILVRVWAQMIFKTKRQWMCVFRT